MFIYYLKRDFLVLIQFWGYQGIDVHVVLISFRNLAGYFGNGMLGSNGLRSNPKTSLASVIATLNRSACKPVR